MSAVAAYAFEDNLFRALDREGEPWFIAGDVSRILGHRDAKNLTRSLDDDEKGVHFVDTPGGSQEVAVISEPGLYRAIIQRRSSAKLAPEVREFVARFQRWVFHELLPTLRRTGRYGAPPAPAEPSGEAIVRERELRLETVAEARRLYGAERARQLWERLGLPEVPPLPAGGAAERADAKVFEAHPVLAVLRAFIEAEGAWTGRATQLLGELNRIATRAQRTHALWPSTAAALSATLWRQRGRLAQLGILVDRRHSGVRTLTITLGEAQG